MATEQVSDAARAVPDRTLEGVLDCWIEPNGRWHKVEPWGHDQFASEYLGGGADSHNLYDHGWIKLSDGAVFAKRANHGCWIVNQKQLDFLFDWYRANGIPFNADRYEVC